MLKIFAAFLFLSAVIQLASAIAWFCKTNNMPLLHFYVAAGFVGIALFYREVFSQVLDRRIMLVVTILFVLFTLTRLFPTERIFRFNAMALTVESVLVIIFSLATFLLFLNDLEKQLNMPSQKTIRWINAGFFIYYSSSLLIFYFSDMMAQYFPVYINQYTWIIHSFFSVVMYSCFIIALWKRPKPSVS